jgi:Reverse transcriptase (RNA-dependent DNA polymerase)
MEKHLYGFHYTQKYSYALAWLSLYLENSQVTANTQTGFMKRRNILHGFHYTQKIIGEATKQKRMMMVFKADMHKAFDSLEWDFLVQCLRALNLPDIFVK